MCGCVCVFGMRSNKRERERETLTLTLIFTPRSVQIPEKFGAVRTIADVDGEELLVGTTRNAILRGTFSDGFMAIVQVRCFLLIHFGQITAFGNFIYCFSKEAMLRKCVIHFTYWHSAHLFLGISKSTSSRQSVQTFNILHMYAVRANHYTILNNIENLILGVCLCQHEFRAI